MSENNLEMQPTYEMDLNKNWAVLHEITRQANYDFIRNSQTV